MGAGLLAELHAAGVTVTALAGSLVVTPASRLTDELRAALREAKAELLAGLSTNPPSPPPGPYWLTKAQADAAHATPWSEAECNLFLGRKALLQRRGLNEADAGDLAELLHLRDLQGDERRLCGECAQYRSGACADSAAAGIGSPTLPAGVWLRLQHCTAFSEAAFARGGAS